MLSKSIDGFLSAILFEEPARSSQAEPPRICDSMDCELFLVGAGDRSGLVRKLCDLEALKSTDASPPLWTEQDSCRAAVIAADRSELFTKTRRLRQRLESKNTKSLNTPDGIYFREQIEDRSKTAFLMPGQGSQYLGMLSDLCIPIPQLQVWFERLEASFDDSEPCPPSMIISSPAVGLTDQDKRLQQKRLFDISGGAMASLAACLGMHDLLIKCGVELDAILGYSNGENAALIASGFWYFQDVDAIFLMLDRVRKDDSFDNSKLPIAVGEIVAVNKAPRETLQQVLGNFNGQVYLALDNCPDQVVLFGERSSLAKVVAQLSDAGAICIPLPFDRGHHTPVYEPHANSLRKLYKQFIINRPSVPVYSCAAAAPFPGDPDAARELAASQWTKCVRFRETVERMYADGLRTFVEVGPSSSLTGFVHSCLRRRPHTAIACNIHGRPALNQLLNVLGILFVEGHSINLDALHPRSTPAKEPASAEPMPLQTETAGLLAAHFRLMQDFLASQARVHALFTNSMSLPANALAPSVSNALIGHKLVRGGNTLSGVRLFHTTSDPFLLHHAFGRRKQEPVERCEGLPVIPFTISMEMLAEAACSLAHRKPSRLKLKNVRAARWLAVDEDGLSVGIEAGPSIENDPAGGVGVAIFERLQNRAFKAFEGIVEFETGALPSPLRPVRGVQPPRLSAEQFNERLFHGPLFLSLRSILAVADNAIEARAIVPSLAGFFAENSRPEFLLPAPLLDTAGQLVAYWLGEQRSDLLGLFPFELEGYMQFAPPPAPGSPINVRASISLSGQTTNATIDLLNQDGALLARLEGLKMRVYGSEDPYLRYLLAGDPTVRLSVPTGTGTEFHLKLPNSTLFDAQSVWTRLLARLTLSKTERDIWARIPGAERVRWLAATILSKEAALGMSGGRRLRLTELICRSRGDSIYVSSPLSSSVAALIRIHQTGDELCASSVQDEFVTAIEERVYA
jgi:malonyl CoA-acyl carrier protein transacylase